jgi:four helix bundle protein
MYKFSFENLTVWQDTRLVVSDIYKDTKEFPDTEKFGLTNQIRRSAVSVSSNIAEGSSRSSNKE